jgi:cobalt/nickel transport protein
MMPARFNDYRKLWIGLGLLILMSPLGVLLPGMAKSGGSWGEWGVEELRSMLGYVPARLEKLRGLWKALFPDYSIAGMHKPWQVRIAYLLCSIVGAAAVIAICLFLGKWLSISEDNDEHHVA